ncbi:MAG: Fur family transcriptional regulator [Cellulosilyticaceae bacterium]
MSIRPNNYKTKQKEEILEYLKSVNNAHITVQQISKHLEDNKTPVGITTIYRYLDTLVAKGLVKKYILEGVCGACFQYIGKENLSNHIFFHFKCENCGELVHFECEELEALYCHLLKDHGLNIDLSKTMYYGKCNECNME